VVNLVVRVPAAQFSQTMEEIRAAGARVVQEKITGQDVTEEFLDLEARIKNQKALEAQFLEIMKRAAKVEEALDVQKELADVRTEIEKLEGRRRFLENQASLSTINVTLQPPTQIVNAAGFWYSIKAAFSDGVDAAAAIVLFLIRVVIALLPLLILFVLPIVLIARFLFRRMRRKRLAQDRANAAEVTT
jgi:Flp pilus assembly protein TadB